MSSNLNDRDLLAIYKVLDTAIHKAEFCFDGVRHGRMVYLQLQQYIDSRINVDKDFEKNLKINL